MPTTPLFDTLDPIETRRLRTQRPANRMEIARRVHTAQRTVILSGQPLVEDEPARFAHRTAGSSNSMTRVREGISRALNAAANRITPKAA